MRYLLPPHCVALAWLFVSEPSLVVVVVVVVRKTVDGMVYIYVTSFTVRLLHDVCCKLLSRCDVKTSSPVVPHSSS